GLRRRRSALERRAEIGVLRPAGPEHRRGSARRRATQGSGTNEGGGRGGRSRSGAAPVNHGYDPDDVKIIEAIARFRAGGYDEALGFTVYDTLRYREALAPLVEEESRVLLERLSGEDPEKAVDIIRAGREPLRELIGAIHSKLLLQALERTR